MDAAALHIVVDYRDTAKVAFNVLVGALERDPVAARAPVVFVGRRGTLARAVAGALAAGARRVLVCWSFYSPAFPEVGTRLRELRAALADPRVLHVAGGVHATAEPLATLRAGFDLAALGEGERTIVALARALLEGRDPREVPGIASLGPQGALVARGRAEPVASLDEWPPFAPAHGRAGPIEITRGCIYACRFCQTPFFNGARFRHRSVENICHWVAYQRARGFRDYRFISPTSLSYGSEDGEPRLDRLEELLARVRETIGPRGRLFYGTFPSEVRPEHVTPQALAILARYADNRSLIIGGQSGSEAVLAASHRGHGAVAIERAVRVAIEAGFEPHVDLIFGLPGETPGDVEATLLLAESLAARGARIHAHTFMPLPGTPFRDAPPGRIAPETRRRLLRLTGTRRLYGEWEKQVEIASALAAMRAAAGPRRALPVL